MIRIAITLTVCFCLVSTAGAGVPDPDNSAVIPWDAFGDQIFVSPGAWGDHIIVFVEDSDGNPCPWVKVEIDISACNTLCVDCPSGLVGMTNQMGWLMMDPRVGGYEECEVVLRADGVVLRTFNRVTSPDWDGTRADGDVDITDFSYFALNYPSPPMPYEPALDYNGDGIVGAADSSLFGACYPNENTFPCEDLSASCEIKPRCLDFGVVAPGDSLDQTFTIVNNNPSFIAGTVREACEHYSIASDSMYFLLTGESLQVTVRFAPDAEGTHNCMIDTGELCDSLFCAGIGGGAPVCEVVPTTIYLDTVPVWNTKDTTFTITNAGGGFLGVDVQEWCPDFDLLEGAGSYSIPSGGSVIVTVQFAPSVMGSLSCQIDLGDTLCAPVDVIGVGGDPPVCDIWPTSLVFDTVTVGSAMDTTFTISNAGSGILSVNVGASCSHYSVISGGGSYDIPSGDSIVVGVSFEPSAAGTHGCTIETGNNTLCTDVTCTGVAVLPPICLVQPDTLDFGTVYAGTIRDTTFFITNTGGGLLAGVVSESCLGYGIVAGDELYNLAFEETLVVKLSFEPPDTGTYLCTVDTGDSTCSDVVAKGVCVESPTGIEVTPKFAFELNQNHPNPFNASTRIRFVTDEKTTVSLRIYDISGRLVRTLVERTMTPGVYHKDWDARDNSGTPVSSGVYLYQLRVGNRTQTRKAVLLK